MLSSWDALGDYLTGAMAHRRVEAILSISFANATGRIDMIGVDAFRPSAHCHGHREHCRYDIVVRPKS